MDDCKIRGSYLGLRGLASLSALALALGACSGDDVTGGTDTASSDTASSMTATTTASTSTATAPSPAPSGS
ncbi:MAG: hypothetical protein KC420_18980, partial [Myxococcales bacterium]|nr:hypothetical protein [Myxococcales bacterium]